MNNSRLSILTEKISQVQYYVNEIKKYSDLNDLEHDNKASLSIALKKYQEMCKKSFMDIKNIIENDEITDEYDYDLINLKDTILLELEEINYIIERVDNSR